MHKRLGRGEIGLIHRCNEVRFSHHPRQVAVAVRPRPPHRPDDSRRLSDAEMLALVRDSGGA